MDNDLSAYSGKRRPGYERMLADLRDGERDVVIVYHVDRVTPPADRVGAVSWSAGRGQGAAGAVRGRRHRPEHRRLVDGGADSGHDGSERVRDQEPASKQKMEQNAAAGLPHGGFVRAFGYEPDPRHVRPTAPKPTTRPGCLCTSNALTCGLSRTSGCWISRPELCCSFESTGLGVLRPPAAPRSECGSGWPS